MSKDQQQQKRIFERGNVFFTLFGAVAVVGVLGAGIMSTMRGPLSTMVEVNRKEEAKAKMVVASRLILLETTTQADNGDPDADGVTEPLAPLSCTEVTITNAGCIPATIGTDKSDPWGTQYAYCGWDHGVNVGPVAGLIAGINNNTDDSGIAIGLISAGPDRVFQSTCAAHSTYITKGGDDIVYSLTYGDAVSSSGGLWNIKPLDASTAEIQKNVEIKDAGGTAVAQITQTGSATFTSLQTDILSTNSTGFVEVESGFMLPDNGNSPDTDCDNAAEAGMIRYNSATGLVQFCEAGTWSTLGIDLWQRGAENNEIFYDADFVGVGTNNPGARLHVYQPTDLQVWFSDADHGMAFLNTDRNEIAFQQSGSTEFSLRNLSDTFGIINSVGGTNFEMAGATGNVGIGASPVATNKLLVAGQSDTSADFALNVTNNSGTSIFNVRNNGNVGINDNGPDVPLDVTGDAHFDNSGVVINQSEAGEAALLVNHTNAAATATGLYLDYDGNATAFRVTGGQGGNTLASFERDVGSAGESLQITGSNSDIYIRMDAAGGAGTIWNMGIDDSNGDRFGIWTGSGTPDTTDEFTIRNDGDVGIGTTAPTGRLTIQSSSTSKDFITANASSGSGDFRVRETGTNNVLLTINDAAGNQDLRFHTDGNSWLNMNGNLGIGKDSSITNKLDVGGSIRADDNITAGDNITATSGYIEATAGLIRAGGEVYSYTNKDLTPAASCASSTSKNIWDGDSWECVADLGAGSGTGNEVNLADVLGNGDNAGGLDAVNFDQITAGSTTKGVGRIRSDNSTDFNPGGNVNSAFIASGSFGGGYLMEDTGYLGMWSVDGGATLAFASGGTGAGFSQGAYGDMVIRNNNVGINVDNPTSRLHVVGNTHVAGSITFTGTIRDTSDRRLKDNIKPLSEYADILDRVTQINTYSFTMKDDALKTLEFGVMAQEIKELFPELVETADDEMGSMSVNYMGLIAPMVESIKALKAEHETLHADHAQMKSDIEELKAQVALLNKSAVAETPKASMELWMVLMALAMFGATAAMMVMNNNRPARQRIEKEQRKK